MITILYGKDDFSRDEALEEIRASLDDDGAGDNAERIDGRSVQPDELLARVHTVPFLASRRLVIVDGLLGRFQASASRRRSQPRKNPPALGGWQAFVDGLESMPETTVLVLIDGEVSAGNPLLDALSTLKPKPKAREFSPKRTGELAGWLNQRAATLGIRLEARAVPALAGLVGNNLRLLDSELRKLGTFAGDRAVTAEDVNSLVSLAREANVFAMVDAAAEGRTKDALAEYHRLLRVGEAPQRFLAMIARQFRLMLQTRDLLERGVPQREVQARLRLPNFVAQRVIQQTSARPSICGRHTAS
jgi:DNA polymerase-3 subunit delta